LTTAEKYSAVSFLRDGRQIEIRAQRASDKADLIAAVGRASAQSLFRRFFTVKKHFSDREIEFFTNVDFIKHVALVAMVQENGCPAIIGAGRYVVLHPGKAEVAFTVIDQYQGQGVGTELMCHLIKLARAAKLEELVAEVLPNNHSMLRVLEKSGLALNTTHGVDANTIVLRLQ
jgi:RimJ/RimL family protein N-acetyltransferase